MRACGWLADGRRWQEASVMGSKGCGANMRVTPVGLLPDLDLDTLAGLSQLQAGLTHGHPTGLAAAELTAYAVRVLLDGVPLADLPARLRDRATGQRTVYRGDWLGDLWSRWPGDSAEEYIARGWDECLAALDRLDAALRHPNRTADPCQFTGSGSVAEEALATGLLCALLFADEPVAALGRAAATSGDSDSIACLTGAFLGAAYGMDAWPADWASRIEYADQLRSLSYTLADRSA
jgi:ADP-ribosylglycohydrolase